MRRRGVVASLLLVALGSATLVGCDAARVGQRCSGGFARDATHVLICKSGHYAKWMTFRDYLLLVERANQEKAAAAAVPPLPPPAPPPPPSGKLAFTYFDLSVRCLAFLGTGNVYVDYP